LIFKKRYPDQISFIVILKLLKKKESEDLESYIFPVESQNFISDCTNQQRQKTH